MSLCVSVSLSPSTSKPLFMCPATEKEERIQKEKDQGTYKEKVFQHKITFLPVTTLLKI